MKFYFQFMSVFLYLKFSILAIHLNPYMYIIVLMQFLYEILGAIIKQTSTIWIFISCTSGDLDLECFISVVSVLTIPSV